MDLDRILISLRNVLSAIPPHDKVFLTQLDRGDLEAVLFDQTELRIFDNKIHFDGSGWGSMKIRNLALWLMNRALAVDPETAVANLSRYLTDSNIPFREIMVLGGVRVSTPIQLSNGIELLPFESLEALYFKEDIARRYKEFHANHQPSSALQLTFSYPRDRCHLDANTASTDLWFPTEPEQQLEDARLCITAIGPCAPVMLGNWAEPKEWVPASSSASGAIPTPFNIGGYPREMADDFRELPEIHARWVKLAKKEQLHLRVPLGRINTALRREKIVDSAIDLGIAIDALFLAEREADRGELGFTLRLRAARYLGHDEPSRRNLSKVFSALWRMRSAAVHTGEIPTNIDGFNTYDLLKRGYDLTGRAISRIICEGEPDWQKVIFA